MNKLDKFTLLDLEKLKLAAMGCCGHICKHSNYCILKKNHKGKHVFHNSALGLRYKYCECDY